VVLKTLTVCRLFTGLVREKMRSFAEPDHLLLAMGNDFSFQEAAINYRNMDKAIHQALTHPTQPMVHSGNRDISSHVVALLQSDNNIFFKWIFPSMY
jgi:hypothetical protein